MTEIIVSKKWSMVGYSLTTALKKNKEAIKLYLLGITTYNFATGFEWKKFLVFLGIGAIALVGKIIIDAFDYWASEVAVTKSV